MKQEGIEESDSKAKPAANAAPEPVEDGLATRWGERILGLGGIFSRPITLLSRCDAVSQGVGSVVVRILAGAGLLGLSWVLGSIYGAASMIFKAQPSRIKPMEEQIQELFRPAVEVKPLLDPALLFVIWMLVAGTAILIFWNDWHRKWRVLHWLIFVMVTLWTLMFAGSKWFQLAVLTGQFGMHWFVGVALSARDRRAEWEQELAAARRRETRVTERRLQEIYRGHSGFLTAAGALKETETDSRSTPENLSGNE